jgi:triacylglycerol lipase
MKIILAHGVLGFGVLGPLQYFNGVAEYLEHRFPDVVVKTARVNPIGSVPDRAEELAAFIAREAQGEKVHVFAHSMGGLDARYAIAKDLSGTAARIATLVTIGTPHLGSEVADKLESGKVAPRDIIRFPFAVELQINQAALHDLTTRVATDRDAELHDVSTVRYLYVAGDTRQPHGHQSLAFSRVESVFGLAAPSDGVVTVHSATRGGMRKLAATWPTDHAGEIGWNLDRPVPVGLLFADSSHLARYEDLVRIIRG